MSNEYDIVVKDGLIFDGTGAPRVRGDVGISGGRVTALGRVDATDAAEVIDARGMHVAPGFVDLHTHYDAQVFWDPYCTRRAGTASPPSPSATAGSASRRWRPSAVSTPCGR
ncbi:MAG: amidohydrolase family protein [Actinomycetota bacterium]|nr:amidohydrolase family protein [Actinomycetota bacterium]